MPVHANIAPVPMVLPDPQRYVSDGWYMRSRPTLDGTDENGEKVNPALR